MELSDEFLFKFLLSNRFGHFSCVKSLAKWEVPSQDLPGTWMPKIAGKLVPCQTGYHLARKKDLIEWIGPLLYVAEPRGQLTPSDRKVVASEVRLLFRVETWNDRTARLFAADCAEHVLAYYQYIDVINPQHTSIRQGIQDLQQAIQDARACADDLISPSEMLKSAKLADYAAKRLGHLILGSKDYAAAWAAALSTKWATSKEKPWVAARKASKYAAACVGIVELAPAMITQACNQVVMQLASRDPDQELGDSAGDSERKWQNDQLWSRLNRAC
ncbi:MAG: hypothetical protein HY912_14790 [Desulfomonile tiedjei]|uniref:Uncharacterized protein n=1 Tax=Desulfomonile tiedjei TaxID=2358 RepID=A0A9D6Z4B5_9BACT|nr:hypothetical protein [Desulfomonile tiedjei]